MLKYLPITFILLTGCTSDPAKYVPHSAEEVSQKRGNTDNLCHCPDKKKVISPTLTNTTIDYIHLLRVKTHQLQCYYLSLGGGESQMI